MVLASNDHYPASPVTALEQTLSPETALPAPRRKRHNSLIPLELRNDNSEGGMERAALATVFGVKEYTESKIFWEHQASAYYDGGTGFRPDSFYYSGGDQQSLDNAGGNSQYNTATSRSIVRSNSDGSTRGTEPIHRPNASFVDTKSRQVSRDGVSSGTPPTATNNNTVSRGGAHKPTSFALPEIPKVSQFNDLFVDRSSSFLLRPPTPPVTKPKRQSMVSSICTTATTEHHSQGRYASQGAVPLVFVGNKPELFDLLVSDDDERIIIWGYDPQYVSASMATTTKAGKSDGLPRRPLANTMPAFEPSAVSTAASSTSTTTAIHGFSSNATTAAASGKDSPKSSKQLLSRWPGLADGLKISRSNLHLKIPRPHPLTRHNKVHQEDCAGVKDRHGSRSLFPFGRNHGKNVQDSLPDDRLSVNNDDHIPKVIEAATIEKLVEKLTSTLDYTFMTDFFLTYRLYINSTQLCKLLILRFRWALENDNDDRRVVRIRTFVVIRHWLLNYFLHDFTISQELRVLLTSFLNSLPYHPLVKRSPRDQRIVKNLKRVVRRLKKVHYPTEAPDRVQIIAPPGPSFEQERVEEMVRAKLSQGPIARTTALVTGVDVGDRHHGNIAVPDARSAPVLVVGSVRHPKGSGMLDVDGYRSSPTNPIRRNITGASVTRLPLIKNKKDIEAVKQSYMQRMEQQKRQMEIEQQQSAAESCEPADPDDALTLQTDNSLESILTPGKGFSEIDDEEYSARDDNNAHQVDNPATEFYNEHVTARLEYERHLREEEEERMRAAFFAKNTAPIHPLAIDGFDLSVADQYTTSPQSLHPEDMRRCGSSSVEPSVPQEQHGATDKPISNKQPTCPSQLRTDPDKEQHHAVESSFTENIGTAKPQALPNTTDDEKHSSNEPNHDAPPHQVIQGDGMSTHPVSLVQGTSGTSQGLSSLAVTCAPSGKAAVGDTHQPVQRITELDIPLHSTDVLTPRLTRGLQNVSSLYGKSFILSYRTETMAHQFCLIEARVLSKINWEELVHCRWTKMKADSSSPICLDDDDGTEYGTDEEYAVNYYSRRKRKQQLAPHQTIGGVEQVIKRFNATCLWVSSEIVRTRHIDDRVKVIQKFIRLAEKCKRYCNFATLVQILLGLQSPAVSRLRKTWSSVNQASLRLLDQLSEFTSPMKNWKHIRDSMTEIADKYGMSPTEVQIEMPGTNWNAANRTMIKIPFGGCIPFLGIYLSDLVFNSEQPPYLQPRHRSDVNQDDVDPLLKQPLVNFRKHRITATVIKRVLIFQSLASRYSFAVDDELLRYCSELESHDAETIKRFSYEIESDLPV